MLGFDESIERDLADLTFSCRQLGHAKPSLTADIYVGRKKRANRAA